MRPLVPTRPRPPPSPRDCAAVNLVDFGDRGLVKCLGDDLLYLVSVSLLLPHVSVLARGQIRVVSAGRNSTSIRIGCGSGRAASVAPVPGREEACVGTGGPTRASAA